MADGGQLIIAGQSVDPQAILARYLSDESTAVIAKDYGVTRQALGQFLLKHDEEGWRSAQVARALAVKEQADDILASLQARIDAFRDIKDKDAYEREREACRLQLSLADARAKRAHWDLERLLSRLFGQKQELHHSGGLTVEIVKFSGTTLDGAAQRVAEPFSSGGGAFASDAQAIDNAG